MKGHLSLSTLESPSSKTVPDSLLDMICLHFDNKPEDSGIMTPIYFCGSCFAFDF